MPRTQIDKSAVIDALSAQWAALRGLAAEFDEQHWAAPSVLPGWTNADIIAHIVGTESMLDGRDVDAPSDLADRAHIRNPIGELNEKWVEHFRSRPRAEVLAAFDDIVAVRRSSLDAMSAADFDADAMTPAGPDTYGRFMRIRVFDCWIHEIDLRDAIGAGEPEDPIPAGWALDEIGASLPFVVGKRAHAPAGSTILIDITGIAPRQVRIAVAERAAAVDAFDGGDTTADVTLRVDGVALARLVGGRPAADPATVAVTGDHDLGAAIVASLHYLI